jgi:hypothetical protein
MGSRRHLYTSVSDKEYLPCEGNPVLSNVMGSIDDKAGEID